MGRDASASGASHLCGHPPLAGGSYDEPDPSDPTMLVGVALPAEPGAIREMAWVFAEEFARLGFSAVRIMSLFRSPFYAGAHRALQVLGEDEVAAIVEECARAWGPRARQGG